MAVNIPGSENTVIDFWLKLSLLIGLLKLSKTLVSFFSRLLLSVRKPNLQPYGPGTWALVTGASQGIGKAFCQQLARLGFNICLASRSTEKLQAVDKQLRVINPKIQTRLISCDFSSGTSPQFYEAIVRRVSDLDVSVLVNNVGMVNVEKFDGVEEKRMRDELCVNILAVTALSRLFIPVMLRRNKKSAIVNLSSTSFEFGLRELAVYNATKAFGDMLSRSLSSQHRDKLDIISVKPLGVRTRMTKFSDHPFAITPNQCAYASLAQLGVVDVTQGHLIHSVQAEVLMAMPQWVIGLGERQFYKEIK